MIEIIPNWHPIFVHFTVALYTTAVGFYILHYATNHLWVLPKTYVVEFEVVARWCLWVAALMAIVTVAAGLYAYNTISRHDSISHSAMIDHRNWALPTAGMIILTALWSVWRYYKKIALTLTFLIALVITQGMLLSTAWHGAEVVYRYGIGVLSLPQAEGEAHDHLQGEKMKGNKMDHSAMPHVENNESNNQKNTAK